MDNSEECLVAAAPASDNAPEGPVGCVLDFHEKLEAERSKFEALSESNLSKKETVQLKRRAIDKLTESNKKVATELKHKAQYMV